MLRTSYRKIWCVLYNGSLAIGDTIKPTGPQAQASRDVTLLSNLFSWSLSCYRAQNVWHETCRHIWNILFSELLNDIRQNSRTLTTQLFFQVNSTVERSIKIGNILWRPKRGYWKMLRLNLHFRSKYFGYIWIQKIIRPMVKRWAQSDQRFKSFGVLSTYCGPFLRKWSKKHRKRP